MRRSLGPAVWPRARPWWRSEAAVIGSVALVVVALHLVTNALYGFHRDELYYLDSARHLALGYVDYPPVVPLIARLSLWLFGTSVWGLRLWPTLAAGAMVVLAAMIARELGGGRVARMLAAVGAATGLVLLGANWLFQTVTFDQLVWLVCIWLVARLVRTGDRRLWTAIGAAIGVGLETKYTILGLVAGLLAGVALTPLRRDLRTRWPWLGIGAAVLLFLPNLTWQISNGWPSLDYTVNHHAAQAVDFAPLSFLGDQLSLIGPLAIPVWVAGLWWLLAGAGRRVIGIAAAVAFAVFLLVGKGYYIGPLDPVLLAAGACAIEQWTAERRRWLPRATAAALILQAVVLLPIAIPLLPEATMARSSLASIRTDFADTVGWDDLVGQVALVYDGIGPTQRAATTILTNNYGEAGAVDTLGASLGLPEAHSGELSYYYWKPASLTGPVIAVGFAPAFLGTLFEGCSQVATVTNRYGRHNQEFGSPIALCTRPRLPLAQLWAQLKSFH
jgi:4-amino-4-deoxy-L-arabinose transferase-like glycosyltransferase